MQHHRFIQVYSNVLSDQVCSELIDIFERHPAEQMRVDNNRRPNFSQICLNRMKEGKAYLPVVIDAIMRVFRSYRVGLDPFVKYLPKSFSVEEIRIKRYRNDGIDVFDDHVDVGDHLSASRYLAFLFYLNTVDVGGETVFLGPNNYTVKPKVGHGVVFPPNWQFPHRGCPPMSGNKYIMSSYLQFK